MPSSSVPLRDAQETQEKTSHRGTGEDQEFTTEFCCPTDSLEYHTEFHGVVRVSSKLRVFIGL